MPTLLEVSVQKEFEKNADIKPKDIQSIRDWLKQQPHLPYDYITDFDTIMAFHSCQYCDELTKKVIELNYTLRSLFDFYHNRRVDKELEIALHSWLIAPLEMPTNKGYKVVYCQLLDADPNKFVYADVVRVFIMILDLWQWEEGTVRGVALIINMDKVSLAHLSRIDLNVAQQFFYFLQEAMFVRLREFHFINASSFMDNVMSMFRPFMKRELLDMVRVHQAGSNSLDEYLPKAALPQEAGGENKQGIFLRDEVWNKIKANESFFDEESKKRVDEWKRRGGAKTISHFFSGMEGSFKKLDID